jgi:hypothetical protein
MWDLVGSNGKVSASHISKLPRFDITEAVQIKDSGLYRLSGNAYAYDFAFYKKEAAPDALFVFFCGYIDRRRVALPAFHRWSWHAQLPGHTLYISDPTLMHSTSLGIGWYIGSINHDTIVVMRDIVRATLWSLRLREENLVFYGSSGGGFAALRMQAAMPRARSICVNPQVRLTSFVGSSPEDNLQSYLSEFFRGMTKQRFAKRYPLRNDLRRICGRIGQSRVVYAQNTLDRHHVENHMALLFPDHLEGSARGRLRNACLVLFQDEGGHDAAEPRSLVPLLIDLTRPSFDAGQADVAQRQDVRIFWSR